jgi:hypothetical protein
VSPAEREHDLPPRWDGHAITWRGWRQLETSMRFHLPLSELACRRCGLLEEQLVNRGRFDDVDGDLREPLTAFRCPGCQHDQVLAGDELWDLDETDYGPDGSRPPASYQPPAMLLEEPAPATIASSDLRDLPAPQLARSFCHGCGHLVVWATTVAGPNGPGGKLQPFDPREDLAGRIAITQPIARGRLLARALSKEEQVDRPLEYAGMTHFATCPVKAHPAPPMELLEQQTQHLGRRGGRR